MNVSTPRDLMMLQKLRQPGRLNWWYIVLPVVFVALVVVVILVMTGSTKSPATTASGESSQKPSPSQLSLRITRPRSLGTDADIHHLHISEIEVYKKSDGSRLALSCANPCINPMGHHPGAEAILAIDGDVQTGYHNRYIGQYDPTSPFYGTEDHFLNFNIAGASSKDEIGKIKIIHKHPQPRRIVGVSIELLSNGTRVWNSVFEGQAEEYEFTIA